MSTLRLAIVGCGAMAEWHLDALEEAAPRTKVVAAVDPDPVRAAIVADLTGAAVFATMAAALSAGGVHAVALVVPHHLHEQLALEAFAADVHVALEKPMAPTIDACDRILAAAPTDRVFMVTENSQYWPEVLVARDLIADGAIGDVLTARSWSCAQPPAVFYPGDKPWRFQAGAMGGGAALDTGSHWLRPLRIVLGEVAEVIAVTGRSMEAMDGESIARALLRFRSGVTASLDVIMASGPVSRQPHLQFIGRLGEIVVTNDGVVELYDAAHPTGTAVFSGGYMLGYRGVWADFEAAVLDGHPLAASAEYSLGEVRTALAINRSAVTHAWESVQG